MLPLKPRWTIAKLALATAAAVAVALPALTYPAMAAEAPTPKEQMLQSVSVSVGSNGAVRSIASSELSSAKKNGQAVGSHSFDPSKAAIDLPVRVKVAYKHDGKVGTNLRDLEGTNGRVEIDISVQNLLVRPKTLHFDSAGAAHSRTDLVGVPLTVVAAAKADFSPERVVMPERGGKGGTNGVLSQDESGKAAVQWASVLAPPQLSASTKLQFVVNAKDFEVPDLEINVQPGIVTDPSINSLLESTFDPAKSTEFKTVNNTVEMLAELNGTLAQAGDTISAARQSLSQSANAIGAKTIGDLKASNDHLVESAKSMISSTETMGQGLKQSLSGAQDGFNAQLGSSLAEIRNLLGNPEEAKPVRRVDSEGCAVTVDEQREPRSLFSNLQAVSAQLDEFASAAQSCKETTRQAFLELVGPENPTAEACESAPESVSCMLTDSKGRLRKIATGFEQNGNAALAALDPRTGADSVAAMKDLSDSVDQVGDRLEQLSLSDPVAKLHARSGPIKSAIVGAEHNLEDLRGYFNALHEKAVKQAENAGNAHTQVGELREEICKLTDGAVLPGEDAENSTEVGDGPLSRIQSDRLLRYLSERACGNQIDAKGRPLLIHKGKSGQ